MNGKVLWPGAVVTLLLGAYLAAQGPGGLRFEHVHVDTNGPLDVWLKAVGDLNGDGKPDLIAGGVAAGGLVWYENPAWRRHILAAGKDFSTSGQAVDMDGDGDVDVVVLTSSQLLWLENPTWRRNVIANVELHDIEAGDFDGDGDMDVIGRNQSAFGSGDRKLHFFRQDGQFRFAHLTVDALEGEGLAAADLDRDGDLDVVMQRVWLENPGRLAPEEWKQHLYAPQWEHPHTYIASGDLNGDGRTDIVLSPSERAGGRYRISWFAAPPDPRNSWRENVIEPEAETVYHFIGVADFDRDGEADIATAKMHQGAPPREVAIYRNEGGGRGFIKNVISTTGSHSCKIVDINGDGAPDLYGANWAGSRLIDVWMNRTPPGR